MSRLTLAVAAMAISLACGTAQASTLYFSFSNTIGTVAGTVTGEIDGLNPNGTSTPTAVLVDLYPAGLVEFGSYPTPVNVTDWTGGNTAGGDTDTFTLAGGNFVSGNFSIVDANGVNDQLYINSNCCGVPDTNFFNIGDNDDLYVWNDNGVGPDGISFSTTPFGSVPEPASLAVFGSALTLLARRRKRG
jgi:hypothetical protein